jgi:AraC-like DNA-binding protein
VSTIAFSVIPPIPELQRDVQCFRMSTHTGTEALIAKVCPNGLPGIVFHNGNGEGAIDSITTSSGNSANLPRLFLHGSGAERSEMHFAGGPFTTIQVALKAHALYSIFNIDQSIDRLGFWPVDVFGGDDLVRRLKAATTTDERIDVLSTFLLDRLKLNGKRDELVESSLAHIHAKVDTISVQALRSTLFISERQLEKRFQRVVGLSPKLYIRIKRVNRAIELIRSGRYERLADVAHTLNYFDQSHFVHEIRKFSWVTPTSIAQRVSEFRQDQTGTSFL